MPELVRFRSWINAFPVHSMTTANSKYPLQYVPLISNTQFDSHKYWKIPQPLIKHVSHPIINKFNGDVRWVQLRLGHCAYTRLRRESFIFGWRFSFAVKALITVFVLTRTVHYNWGQETCLLNLEYSTLRSLRNNKSNYWCRSWYLMFVCVFVPPH